MTLDVIRAFAISRVNWVRKHQQRMRERPSAMPLEYVDGESHYLWGRPYLLQVREADAVYFAVGETLGARLVTLNPRQLQRRNAVVETVRPRV